MKLIKQDQQRLDNWLSQTQTTNKDQLISQVKRQWEYI